MYSRSCSLSSVLLPERWHLLKRRGFFCFFFLFLLYLECFRLLVRAPMFVLLQCRHSYNPACLCLVTLLYYIMFFRPLYPLVLYLFFFWAFFFLFGFFLCETLWFFLKWPLATVADCRGSDKFLILCTVSSPTSLALPDFFCLFCLAARCNPIKLKKSTQAESSTACRVFFYFYFFSV